MKALIVEDEPRAQRALENLLKANFPDVEVVGRAASVKETVDWLAGNRPDVIFMDVELADGTCFDIFAQTSVDAQVVMTTTPSRPSRSIRWITCSNRWTSRN